MKKPPKAEADTKGGLRGLKPTPEPIVNSYISVKFLGFYKSAHPTNFSPVLYMISPAHSSNKKPSVIHFPLLLLVNLNRLCPLCTSSDFTTGYCASLLLLTRGIQALHLLKNVKELLMIRNQLDMHIYNVNRDQELPSRDIV